MYIRGVNRIVYYSSVRGDVPIYEFLEELDKKDKAKVMAHISLLEQYGSELKRPYADHVRGKIRELRVQFSTNKYRILHFFHLGNQIVLVHAFLKKTQQLRECDIELAESRMADWIARHPQGGHTE